MRWPIGKLQKYENNPILNPSPLKRKKFESSAVYNPTAIKKNNKIYLFYRAEKGQGEKYTSAIGLAESREGLHFKEHLPVIVPRYDYEKRGCEDPRICRIKDIYYMTYVAYSGKKVSIILAKSKDLLNWRRKVIIKNAKSGSLIPEKINGRFVMYLGDSNIYIATSTDLKRWKIEKEPVMAPRKSSFDSRLVEPGPCPIITKKGIFMVYNSANDISYNIGYAMFDKDNPRRLIARTKKPVLSPSEPWEAYGKVNYVVFAGGLLKHNGKYFIYYGGADKRLGVAIGKELY
jgi:predicted GH43/DUF377 family glycosyl hydrolase